ncbi:glyoxylase-like metal-dependent hydrolase (beta-lactamase superfamily II) [Deinobacterium chartae]|uniref:Glyoxylase-like metal-dependent hydrolase (Beta-lactamase superfamily II) n=1 Tax=Deinobacterium chartae TaxID=521158 RepID=A0A841I4R2_9DEIO|nr:MBL fold metallo-hydrolase [Deinobacterium chartae]MBB6099398.1 glyoxylase-like metal-dependent hydrolase (beta-lactamase superfamily II) [Deinobacterium chartae]
MSGKSDDRTSPASLHRRDALKLLGVAGVSAALGGSTLLSARAQAQTPPPAPLNAAGFYKFKVGDYTVTVLSDGQAVGGNALPNWGANPELQDQFQATLRENFLNPERFVNNFNPMLVDTGTERVLIDTGRGGDAGRLVASLAAAGYQPEQVTVVFLTHGHGDHIGGVTSAPGTLRYPNARLVMGEAEFNFWAGQAQPNAAVQNNLIALRDRFTLVGEGATIVPGVTTVPAYGHTPGQMAVLVSSGNDQVMHLADAGGHYLLSFQYPQQYLGFDADKPAAVATRARLFDRAASERLKVVGYHYPWPGVAYVRKVGNAYQYVPVFYEF